MEHLNLEQFARLRAGRLAGADLLAADDHLASCAQCRDNLQMAPAAAEMWTDLDRQYRAASLAAESHVTFDNLRAYVDGNASPADRMRLETHLLECEDCRAEARDLKSFAAQLQSPVRRYWILAPIAAALLMGVVLMRFHQPAQPQAPQLAVSLRDAGRTIGLDRQGRLVGAAPSDALVEALRDGRIGVTLPEGLHSSSSVLLGADSGASRFHVLSPVGIPVLSDTPEFQWEAVDHARVYKVQVFDADYQLVAASPEVTGTTWTPAQPLKRGKRYAWQVTAIRTGASLRAPQPPDAEARFDVVDAGQAGAIDQARQASAGHLELAVQYAHAGLCREALLETDALERENAGSPLVQQLRAGIAGQCAAQR